MEIVRLVLVGKIVDERVGLGVRITGAGVGETGLGVGATGAGVG